MPCARRSELGGVSGDTPQVSGTRCQAVPFQRTIGGEPTAQARPDGRTETPDRLSQPGIGTTLQEFPSQCSARISPVVVDPTAQAFFAEIAATPPRAYVCPAMAGVAARLHRLPSQCQI